LLIEGGWVKVNGQIEEPQHRVTPGADRSGRPAGPARTVPPATLLWHRPDPETLAMRRPCRQRPDQPVSGAGAEAAFHPAAGHCRPDGLATGLVVFTQDGRMRRRLLEDEAELEQEFMLELPGQLTNERSTSWPPACNRPGLAPGACGGQAEPERARPQGTRLRFALKASSAQGCWTLCQGRPAPLALRRTRLGRVGLAGLEPGQWRFMGPHEKFWPALVRASRFTR
jgi:23S rRNA pseudouridine2604 synthase